MKKHLMIICEREGWTWTIEPQQDCDSGVDLVYCEPSREPDRTCLGDLKDARELANAILAYVNFMEGEECER